MNREKTLVQEKFKPGLTFNHGLSQVLVQFLFSIFKFYFLTFCFVVVKSLRFLLDRFSLFSLSLPTRSGGQPKLCGMCCSEVCGSLDLRDMFYPSSLSLTLSSDLRDVF